MAHFWTGQYAPLYDTEARPRLRYAAGFALGYIAGAGEYLPGSKRLLPALHGVIAFAVRHLHDWAAHDGYDAAHYHAGSFRGRNA